MSPNGAGALAQTLRKYSENEGKKRITPYNNFFRFPIFRCSLTFLSFSVPPGENIMTQLHKITTKFGFSPQFHTKQVEGACRDFLKNGPRKKEGEKQMIPEIRIRIFGCLSS